MLIDDQNVLVADQTLRTLIPSKKNNPYLSSITYIYNSLQNLNILRSTFGGIELTQTIKEILHRIFTCYTNLNYKVKNIPPKPIYHLLTDRGEW